MPAIAKSLAETLKSKFSTLLELSERLGEDVTILDRLVEEQSAEEQQRKEWEKNITYSAEVGMMLKDTLKLSPKGVEWKGQLLPLTSISQVRWGGTRHSVNGVPTGTTYEIHIANSTSRIVINLRNSETFVSIRCGPRGARLRSRHESSRRTAGKLDQRGHSDDFSIFPPS